MTLDDILHELIEALGAAEGLVVIGPNVVQSWPDSALGMLTQSGVLSAAKQAESIECPKCEDRCFMDVHIASQPNKPARAFVVCEESETQGRIKIPLEHLQQWKTSPLHFSKVIAQLLNIECKAEYKHGQTNIRIGMLATKKGRHWLSLNMSPPALEINQHTAPLDEVLFFEEGRLSIDSHRIKLLAEDGRKNKAKSYTPTVEQREAGKRKTEAMYEDWRAEYLRLSKKHPDKSDSWISKQIANLDIAQDRDSETIRKNMKP